MPITFKVHCGRAGRARRLVAVLALALAGAREAPAQETGGVRLHVALAPDSVANAAPAPIVRSENLLEDDRWLTALRSGLPVRLHYRVEVWRSREGWFDTFEREATWDVVLQHEPLLDQYSLLTIVAGRAQERRYATIDALTAALGFSFQVNVRPTQPGRYYYTASLQISTLSDTDLDELRRFLEGDLGEVAQGGSRLGSALGRGATRFLLRLAGLPALRLEARTDKFEAR